MLVHHDLSSLPVFNNAVVTIGTFDGVHLGHQQIIEQLKNEAAHINGETVIITFHPHPRKVVREGQSPIWMLNTLAEKIGLLEKKGIDHLVVVPFNDSFSHQKAEAYIEYFLFEKFHPHTVIIGYDHRFGEGRKGDYHLLEAYGKKLGFVVKEIPERILNEAAISSTRIRAALLDSDVEAANKFLGYHYFFEGTVVKGNQLGRTLGYPTANLDINDKEKLVPGNGVYAVWSMLADEAGVQTLKGMMSIGTRPTINGTGRVIEVNIFDFNADIYGRKLRVFVSAYLRPELRFNALEELKEAMATDKLNTLAILNERPSIGL